MNNEQAKRILSKTNAAKEKLREALAFTFGVLYEKTDEKPKTVFLECRSVFLEAFRKETGLIYQYNFGKDGASLKQMLQKIERMNQSEESDLTKSTFQSLIANLPGWYREHAFSLSIINSKFDEIVAEIRKNGKKTGKGTGEDYARRKLDIINAQG